MLLFLAIFIAIVILFFILVRAVNGVFLIASRIRSQILSVFFIIGFLIIILVGSGIATIYTSYIIVNSNSNLYAAVPQENTPNLNLNAQDCKSLLNTIYLEEERIYKPTNHRYIEEVIPIPSQGEEYEKGAITLRKSAEQYELLNIDQESKTYSDRIANKLKEKADLFETRTTLNQDDGIKPIFQILTEMDRVTSERQEIVRDIKKKCAKSQFPQITL